MFITMRRPDNMTDSQMKDWMETQYDLNDNGCWVWKNCKWKGYGNVGWKMENSKRSMIEVHRLYWLLCGGIIPEGLEMCHGHKCDKACFNPEHLTPATRSENMMDRIRDGTVPDLKGTNNGGSKLTEDQVRIIRTNPEKKTQAKLAEQFGINVCTVERIVAKKTWKHI